MTSNAEIEQRWIDAWNDLSDLVGNRWQVDCLLPGGATVDVETCKGWLQESAYQGYCLRVEEAWIKGKLGIKVTCFIE